METLKHATHHLNKFYSIQILYMACTPGILKILYLPMYSIHLCNVPPDTGQNSQNLQDTQGTIARDIRYINHYLLYVFGECAEQHYSRCTTCDQLFEVFTTLSHVLDSHDTLLSEYQEKLTCYLAHQTRKKYLGAQFNITLDELDEHGAVIVVDYKMRILPATARETKSEFFGKRGWTLHTTLIFQKKDNEKMDVQAY